MNPTYNNVIDNVINVRHPTEGFIDPITVVPFLSILVGTVGHVLAAEYNA